jgi:glutamyl-tRNA synthetase
MSVTVRFAPSPTGRLHIGNARTALFNWLYARRHGGRFILRLDDTDRERSRAEFAEAIRYDLEWLGIVPDMIASQSQRIARYEVAAERLKAAGLLYPCYETAQELELKRKVQLSRRLPPVYDRAALRLDAVERRKLEEGGRRPHWRFLLPNFSQSPFEMQRTEVSWDDLVRGTQIVDLASLSDPVLIREDGTFLYTLPSVVDDIEMGISHVIRGEDHVTNTGAQIALFRALGAEPPQFAHHNLLTTVSGEGLSKRSGALSLAGLREAGIEPMAVAALAVLIGSARSVTAVRSLDELAGIFDLAASSRSAARFDPAELKVLNRTLVQSFTFEEVRERLAAMGIQGPKAEPFWLAVRANLETLEEARLWWRVVEEGPSEEPAMIEPDREFVRQAIDMLPPEPWDETTWATWTAGVSTKTGRKGRALYMPLRLALTGRPSGPELADLLPLLGQEGIRARRP